MQLLPLCLLCLVSYAFGGKVKNALYGYDVQLYGDPKAPRIVLLNDKKDIFNDLSSKESTWCLNAFLVQKEGKTFYTLVGYASREHKEINEVIIELDYAKNRMVYTNNHKELFLTSLPVLNEWTLVCITWSGITGEVHYYLNGKKVGMVPDFQKDKTIGKDGTLVVGQDQDDYDAKYQPDAGMYGKATQFNSWDRVLTSKEIMRVHERKMYGNQVDWRFSQWAMAGNALLLPSDAPNAALQRPTCRGDENTVATDLSIRLRFNGESWNKETFTLFYYANRYGLKELALVINKTRSASAVVGNENRIIPHLSVAEGWQHWSFVWSQDTLKVYINGGLFDTLSDFQEGTKVSSNGDLYVHEANSRKRVQTKAVDYMVVERALSAEEVAFEYRSREEETVPAKTYLIPGLCYG